MGHNGPNSPHQTPASALALFPLLHHLLTCPVFRPAVVSDALIADLSAYLAASASASVSDLTGIAQFQVGPKLTIQGLFGALYGIAFWLLSQSQTGL